MGIDGPIAGGESIESLFTHITEGPGSEFLLDQTTATKEVEQLFSGAARPRASDCYELGNVPGLPTKRAKR